MGTIILIFYAGLNFVSRNLLACFEDVGFLHGSSFLGAPLALVGWPLLVPGCMYGQLGLLHLEHVGL